MNNNIFKIILIIILCILSIGITYLMFKIINGDFKYFNFSHRVSDQIIYEKVYDNIESINIKSTASDIYIKESMSNEIKVVIYGDKEKIDVNNDNNILDIKVESESCIGFCFNIAISKVEVYIPSDYSKNINITNEYGNVEIDKFLNSNIDIKEDCGNIKVLGVNNINIKNNYGNTEIEEANSANVFASAGNVEIKNVNDIVVENNYGNIEIKNIYNSLNLKNDCGDIEIDNIILNKNSNIKSDLGKVKIGKTNEINIDAKTDLGNIKINNNYEQSQITLKIENDCGDIKVNN